MGQKAYIFLLACSCGRLGGQVGLRIVSANADSRDRSEQADSVHPGLGAHHRVHLDAASRHCPVAHGLRIGLAAETVHAENAEAKQERAIWTRGA